MRYERGVAARLMVIETLVRESINKVRGYLGKLGVKESDSVINSVLENYFVIEPVSIEPTDIIKRLDLSLIHISEPTRPY